ncbi:hypothetical protein E2C01_076311 [Portunus trituberculatus]|uniref:Uncharacterized protein n=1 Tax=Portunus trituberculatus TaxID=210409 RepID=A0A5B7I8F3_PORTR|nr:hypothetical protein [Portunus trituberculatus]
MAAQANPEGAPPSDTLESNVKGWRTGGEVRRERVRQQNGSRVKQRS